MRVRLSIQATADRHRLAAFLAEHDQGAALRAVDAITTGIAQLALTPLMGMQIGGLRELYIRFGDSGYVVQYRIDAEAVIVARIFHMREAR
ncbi:type II toxin-antitoxin system RelE/ParE family toxin [Brevundimonas sp. PAMC22021]|uniref:type II toxin-antitoxin system RelE/ParE family toxin n=1 Tax=Brevundimonas sp. PAMC22021 TaxID=2861285 RepID=UPI001C6320F0|nr:type II toxin-antitoxin system RelE/ParE family toxin [Brevundimonas sp. PAMC22021]QYF85982.1 type II toxin-antitoxin system RelE/ParE family toxin [Brevundimonas sp. PAMC22021]